mmetsp:Transcript_23506/g.39894  ORF Transcript_23506/g.39894 Transcript_23506/m.39894 type:complete len:129 (-) Transcript_23506:1199-1585(-)
MAIDKNDNEMATHLMNHSAINLNVCNERGATALHWAAGNKDNTDIALALIKLGAKLDIRNEARYTALHHAARRRNHVLLQALVEAGANWRIKTLHMDLMVRPMLVFLVDADDANASVDQALLFVAVLT